MTSTCPSSSSAYLIVGLGNPGKKYAKTRHNAGFLATTSLEKNWELDSQPRFQFDGEYSRFKTKNCDVFVARPTTFMNLSGNFVSQMLLYYGIPLSNLLVVYDDVDFMMGKWRLKTQGSGGQHNGMRHIVKTTQCLDIKQFRIGVGPKPAVQTLTDYVLGRFNSADEKKLELVFQVFCKAVTLWLNHNFQRAMNETNTY